MTRVVLDMAVSLDGFVAGPNGEDGGLHDYFFNPDPATAEVVAEGIAATGAILMGRRAYNTGAQQGGWADDPYHAAQFVLTHAPPAVPAPGAESFIFVADGLESALRQARAAAGDRLVVIGGGPQLAQQYLQAGLVDELQLHLVSLLLGGGLRLFNNPLPTQTLHLYRLVQGQGVLHLYYRINS